MEVVEEVESDGSAGVGAGGEENMGVSGGWNWNERLLVDEVVGVAIMFGFES